MLPDGSRGTEWPPMSIVPSGATLVWSSRENPLSLGHLLWNGLCPTGSRRPVLRRERSQHRPARGVADQKQRLPGPLRPASPSLCVSVESRQGPSREERMLEETSKKLGVGHAVCHTHLLNESNDLGVVMAPSRELDTSSVRATGAEGWFLCPAQSRC